ncbi:phosphatidate cytidylyltransferase, mitochondrial [Hydra vulgaris]|uniref:Phosphatidate cytidylyltransferase, mitochondrial n=1 Tax=Hydra vulgaris TaxID=6087 RepID=T2M898_HYDVU|nr:phosphatidate cytidylyltransferase, mitochondrial [Hydra vulgaris]
MGVNNNEGENFFNKVIQSFSPGILYGCAYGSGVFKQNGHTSVKNNMIDFIFVVENSLLWHQQNLLKYPHHYSFVRYFGTNFVSFLNKNYGAKVYFNTLIEFDKSLIKYGVIEIKDFVKDLLEWNTLYIAGRLHKPVVVLNSITDNLILKSIDANYLSALNTSLLLLPKIFSEDELYLTIAGLSYTGDPRMIVGEDKGKVKNIVLPNKDKFQKLYQDIFLGNKSLCLSNGVFEQDISLDAQLSLLQLLPKNLLYKISFFSSAVSERDFILLIKDRPKFQNVIQKSISSIVSSSSTTQTLKGVLTAGVRKSVLYSSSKLLKMFKGFLR